MGTGMYSCDTDTDIGIGVVSVWYGWVWTVYRYGSRYETEF